MNEWHPMYHADLPAVNAVADEVHVDYPEDEAVFEERLKLSPKGCFVLKSDDALNGYIISHPWIYKSPPKLNSLLDKLPDQPNTYYIHDIALRSISRRGGAARAIIDSIKKHVRQLDISNISLIAVNNSTSFWEKQGFHVLNDNALDPYLKSYDDDARFMTMEI